MVIPRDPLRPVFYGSVSEALEIQSLLEANGIQAVVPSENTKVLDPFITGGDIFRNEVRVRAADYDSALEVLQERSRSAGHEEDTGPEPEEVDATEQLGRRLRWAAVLCPMFLLNPYFFVLVFVVYMYFFTRFMREARAREAKPGGYGPTVAAFVVMSLFFAVALALIRFMLFP